MSNLLVQTIKHTNNTTAQTIDTSGRTTAVLNNDTTYRSDSGAVTQNMVQSLAKNWVHSVIGSGTPALTDSLNTSSITDTSAGNFDPQLTSAMANATYAESVTVQYTTTGGTGSFFHQFVPGNNTTTKYNLQHYQAASAADPAAFSTLIHGDLA